MLIDDFNGLTGAVLISKFLRQLQPTPHLIRKIASIDLHKAMYRERPEDMQLLYSSVRDGETAAAEDIAGQILQHQRKRQAEMASAATLMESRFRGLQARQAASAQKHEAEKAALEQEMQQLHAQKKVGTLSNEGQERLQKLKDHHADLMERWRRVQAELAQELAAIAPLPAPEQQPQQLPKRQDSGGGIFGGSGRLERQLHQEGRQGVFATHNMEQAEGVATVKAADKPAAAAKHRLGRLTIGRSRPAAAAKVARRDGNLPSGPTEFTITFTEEGSFGLALAHRKARNSGVYVKGITAGGAADVLGMASGEEESEGGCARG